MYVCAFRQSFTPAQQMRKKISSAKTRPFLLVWRCGVLCSLPVWLVPRCSTPLCWLLMWRAAMLLPLGKVHMMWKCCQIILSIIFPIFRYVGEKYSDAQDAMEETMSSFYNYNSVRFRLSKVVVGQLVAVREEDGDEVTRAQVIEFNSPDKVKVTCL